MGGRGMRAKGVSLWLMPTGPVRDGLAGRIRDISRRLRAPVFAPHVTLVPGCRGSEEAILQAAAKLAAAATPLTIELGEPGWRDEYFRCLFLEVAKSPELTALETRARELLGLEPSPDYFPHLSLVYAIRSRAEKRAVAAGLGALERRFVARAVHVYRTEGGVSSWCRLASFGFNSRRKPPAAG